VTDGSVYMNFNMIYRNGDDFVLMAKEETVLQDMIDKLIEIGSCYGVEKNVEKTKLMRISTFPSNKYDRPKTTGECGMF